MSYDNAHDSAHPDSSALCNFEDLLDTAQQIETDVKQLKTNEFGEFVEEDEVQDVIENETTYPVNDDTELNVEIEKQTNTLSQTHLNSATRGTTTKHATWLKNSVLAPTESDKEFELFSFYCRCGGGRTLQYISQTTNFPFSKVQQVAKRNNWTLRAADYDRYQLSKKINEAQNARHEQHLSRLEQYREQQEQIGQQLSLNAARIAYLADRKLSSLLDSEQNLDVRDLPSMLNAASKLAEVGKNLQSNALGVDQLLAAIEESEVD